MQHIRYILLSCCTLLLKIGCTYCCPWSAYLCCLGFQYDTDGTAIGFLSSLSYQLQLPVFRLTDHPHSTAACIDSMSPLQASLRKGCTAVGPFGISSDIFGQCESPVMQCSLRYVSSMIQFDSPWCALLLTA